ncbi:hypothetical protein [Longispora albida]|uniref:hypothetical protein n=1 Tax=Longispora albida TaxID=203523 RepID=UPI000369B373|nr:hypothetical protein [Longispora albida]
MMDTEIASRIDLDEDSLFELLSRELTLGVGPQDPAARRAFGRAWFTANLGRLRAAVCGAPAITAFRADKADVATTISAVADLVASVTSAPAACTVATLLVRYGLNRLCGGGPA